ncbi:MAG: chemotaxis protein CheD [Deltaproteobacteria bacterium]|nr:chemotaxis protein CheD [Deltaproteobacteria bacterium]MBW2010887.1 chemotaxis protein CheD [Deltaproteobacteria bacterium]MBW2100286.1 chemotaxis protein CheD [Deltaproteobacteria bacterium]
MFKESNNTSLTKYFLDPGYVYLPGKGTLAASSLGSCVIVYIYDHKNRIGGLSHFQYPVTKNKKKCTTRYGNISILTLIRMFLALGSKKKHLEAQIFGGAHRPITFSKNMGWENVKLARKALKREGIYIASEDVGGTKGRKVVFNTKTNEVAILKVNDLPDNEWYPYK